MSNLMNQWLKRKDVHTGSDESIKRRQKNETIMTPSTSTSLSTSKILVTMNHADNTTYEIDIGHFLKDSNTICSDHERANLITMKNVPKNDFAFPFSVHIKKC